MAGIARQAMIERGLEPDFPPAALRELAAIDGPADATMPICVDCEKVGTSATIPFHLARYCCGLGQIDEAKRWLGKALLAADGLEELARLRNLALNSAQRSRSGAAIRALYLTWFTLSSARSRLSAQVGFRRSH